MDAMTDRMMPAPASACRETAFEALLATIEARRGEIDRGRHVPRDIVQQMKAAGIYRSAVSPRFGGEPVPPHEFLHLIERIAQVDGSASWVAAFGSANTYYAALPLETQAIIYANGPDQAFAGALYPPCRAGRVAGGWRITGRWRFASGCRGADWISCGITDADNPGGAVLMAVAPAAAFEIIENWDMLGMQGTGSFDISLKDHFIADAWVCPRGSRAVLDDLIYRYPVLAYQAQVHAASNLGLARAAIDIATNMSGGAKIMPGVARLVDRAYFRTELAKAEASLRSYRAFYYDATEEAWDEIERSGEATPEQKTMLRLAATNAAHGCAAIIQSLYRVCGMGAADKSNRMQQLVRDAMVVTQHASLTELTFEQCGGILAGLEATPGFP